MASTEAFQFESRTLSDWRPSQWRDCHVIVAVSGGADSVALLDNEGRAIKLFRQPARNQAHDTLRVVGICSKDDPGRLVRQYLLAGAQDARPRKVLVFAVDEIKLGGKLFGLCAVAAHQEAICLQRVFHATGSV